MEKSKTKSLKYKCKKNWCSFRCSKKSNMVSHELLEHPDLFNKRVKKSKRKWEREWEDIESPEMTEYYALMKKERVSKVLDVDKPLNLYKKRKLNKTFEPCVVDCLKGFWSQEKMMGSN